MKQKVKVRLKEKNKMAKDNAKPAYKEVSRAQISKTKVFVLSECSKGGYTLAQQMSVIDENTGKPMSVFLKGAVHIANAAALEKIRDMFTVALERYKEDHDSVDWDEREAEAAAENNS